MKKTICVFLALSFILCSLSGCRHEKNVDGVSCSEIVGTIRKAYGTAYVPNVKIPDEVLNTDFGLNLADMKDYYGEMPQIGLQCDRIVVVKADSSKAKTIQKCFEQAKENFLKDELQYTDSAKVGSAVILRQGDFVCFFMLGDTYGGTDAGQNTQKEKDFYTKQEQIGIDAWNSVFFDN